jgi:hypothetical protein
MNEFVKCVSKNYKIDLLNKKIRIKLGFISLLCLMILTNVLFAWALPSISVKCCEDFTLNYIDRIIKSFDLNLNLLKLILPFLLLQSDIIFLITTIRFILIKYDKRFIYLLFSIWFLKFFTDWSFYQHNPHDNIELNRYSYYSITGQFNHRNSFISFPISIQFLCLLQLDTKTHNNILFGIIIINMFLSTITFLIMKLFFTFQIIFSFLIVHYLKYLIH